MTRATRVLHWRFWDPITCVGGVVRLGWYYVCIVDGARTCQTPLQYRIKRDMGLIV